MDLLIRMDDHWVEAPSEGSPGVPFNIVGEVSFFFVSWDEVGRLTKSRIDEFYAVCYPSDIIVVMFEGWFKL